MRFFLKICSVLSLMFYGDVMGVDVENKIAEVERSLLPAIQIMGQPRCVRTLAECMEKYQIPSISIAVINEGKLEWAKAYGVKALGTNDGVDIDTLYQAGSISKPVAAVGALLLVQEGKIGLDEDVNEKLFSWKIPENEYSKSCPITLRQLLSHSAGFNVIGFDGYFNHQQIPTLQSILNGEDSANHPPIRVQSPPGAKMEYSGGGYIVMQQLVEDLGHATFAAFMQSRILAPLKMTHSTFSYPLPSEYREKAAYAHSESGKLVEGGWKNYPESAAAGLWTTPTDLVKFVIAIQQSLTGEPALLHEDIAREMIKWVIPPYGLGPVINGEGVELQMSHKGRTDGFFCEYVSYPYLGKGAVVMINSDHEACVVDQVLRAISAAYQWPGYHSIERASKKMDIADLSAYIGRYGTGDVANDIYDVFIREMDGNLYIQIGSSPLLYQLFPVSNQDFFLQETGYDLLFKDEGKKLTIVFQKGFERTFKKLLLQPTTASFEEG